MLDIGAKTTPDLKELFFKVWQAAEMEKLTYSAG